MLPGWLKKASMQRGHRRHEVPGRYGNIPKTVAFLRDMGHDGVHLRDEHLERAKDPVVLEKARNEERVLLTHDLDFGELIAASAAKLPSVIIFRLRDMRPYRVNEYLHRIISDHSSALEKGAIVSVTVNRVRVRSLPIQ